MQVNHPTPNPSYTQPIIFLTLSSSDDQFRNKISRLCNAKETPAPMIRIKRADKVTNKYSYRGTMEENVNKRKKKRKKERKEKKEKKKENNRRDGMKIYTLFNQL